MPLDTGKLKDGLLEHVFNNPGYGPQPDVDFPGIPAKAAETARRWVLAWKPFAKDAITCGGKVNPSVLDAQAAVMQASLAAAFIPPQVIPTTAAAIINAVGVFWSNPLLYLPIPPAGPATIVNAATGAVPAIAALVATWVQNAALLPLGQTVSADTAAQQIASALAAYTTSITVVHTLPAPPFSCSAPLS